MYRGSFIIQCEETPEKIKPTHERKNTHTHNIIHIFLQHILRYSLYAYKNIYAISLSLLQCVVTLFLLDYRRRQRLLDWVSKKVGTHSRVWDFCTCWQDGTVLCALLEAICPGVCPSYHLLSNLNRVKNCRLGLKLANKYLYVPLVSSG